jgi:hypothetical protein
MNPHRYVLLSFVIICLLVCSGCVSPSGCVPLKIDDKKVTTTNWLTVTINDEEYQYCNPTLTTFSELEKNHTYAMRFQPMWADKQYVELCNGVTK